MSKQIDRAELRRLCEAATPGPWQWVKDGCECHARGIHIHESLEDDPPIVRLENFQEEENAAFIAAARTAVPALLDALEAAEARERRLMEALSTIKTAAGNAVWNAGQGKRAAGKEYDRCWKHVTDIASKALTETAP